MRVVIPDPALVVLVGPSGSGKSTFAARVFPPNSILSSDELRRVIADDANDQQASADAFRVLALLVEGRLRRRLLTVVDATNLRTLSRKGWLRVARRYGVPAVAIVFDLPLDSHLEHNRRRPGRSVEEGVVREQHDRLAAALAELAEEPYAEVHFLRSPAQVAETTVELKRGAGG